MYYNASDGVIVAEVVHAHAHDVRIRMALRSLCTAARHILPPSAPLTDLLRIHAAVRAFHRWHMLHRRGYRRPYRALVPVRRRVRNDDTPVLCAASW